MKEKYYSVKASKEQNEGISFHKAENGMIEMHMGYSEVKFTARECLEMAEKLKECIRDAT